jgi:hypothetical protein
MDENDPCFKEIKNISYEVLDVNKILKKKDGERICKRIRVFKLVLQRIKRRYSKKVKGKGV